MKKAILGVGGAIVVALLGGALYAMNMKPAQRPASTEKIEATPARLERGRYLTEAVIGCTGCHSEFDTAVFSMPPKAEGAGKGGLCFNKENAGFPGVVCAQNITSDKETGIGSWTDGEVLRAIREGVDRNGNALFPMMPYQDLRNLSDEDTKSVVAYVRTFAPVKRQNPPGHVDFPVSFFIKFAPKPLEGPVQEPNRKDTIAYGKYLSGSCIDCHSPVDEHMQRKAGLEFSGGRDFDLSKIVPGLHQRSANLTPDETGLKAMTRENFIGAFRAFRDPAILSEKVPTGNNTLMPWIQFSKMTDEDLGAIYDYLRSVPPIQNAVERRPRPVGAKT